MNHSLKHYSFLIPCILFLIHQLLQKVLQVEFEIADYYLDPFCLGALVPHALLLEHKLLFDKSFFYIHEIVVLFILLTFISEGVFPLLSAKFTADWLDAVAISLGIVWFILTSKKIRLA